MIQEQAGIESALTSNATDFATFRAFKCIALAASMLPP